jgi:hypothetical protein
MARIRSSPRGKAAAVNAATVAAARDIDFPHLWRQLRAAGWTHKRPTGLSTEWGYATPDGSRVFYGECALVAHALESGLLDKDGDAQSDNTEGDDVQGYDAEGDDVQCDDVSQVGTSLQLSQRTLNTLFNMESDVELSQASVPRAFEMSPSDLTVNVSQQEAATSLQLLSEASGLESEAEPPAAATPPASTRRALRPRLQFKTDVNFVPEGENMSDYESFSSGDSDGQDVDEDDESPDREGFDETDDVISDADAVQMDDAFIEALQIGSNELNNKAKKARKDTLRAMQWTPVSSSFESGALAYDGLGVTEAQPVPELRALCHSPLDTFFFFMPKSLWVLINVETNRYGLQQIERRASAMQAKQVASRRETLPQIRRRLMAKPGYQTHEILHVIGLLVARMLCPQKRRFSAHWSMVEDGALPAGNFGRFMARNRCQDILRDLHMVDNEAPRTRDKLWKLRPVVEKLQQRFLAGWSLPAVFSFDEGVLPSTSRRNTTRMFMPDKPHRYGSKMFMTCDSRTAYCHRYVFLLDSICHNLRHDVQLMIYNVVSD